MIVRTESLDNRTVFAASCIPYWTTAIPFSLKNLLFKVSEMTYKWLNMEKTKKSGQILRWQNTTKAQTAELQCLKTPNLENFFSFPPDQYNNQEKFNSFQFFVVTLVRPLYDNLHVQTQSTVQQRPFVCFRFLSSQKISIKTFDDMWNDKPNNLYRKKSFIVWTFGGSSQKINLAGVQWCTKALTSSEHSLVSTNTYVHAKATQLVAWKCDVARLKDQ